MKHLVALMLLLAGCTKDCESAVINCAQICKPHGVHAASLWTCECFGAPVDGGAP